VNWFRVDSDMVDHPKVHSLALALGGGVDAVGIVIRLWSWTSRFCPTGHVTKSHVTALIDAATRSVTCPPFSAPLLSALCDTGFLECDKDGGVIVYGWAEKQKIVATKAEKDRERQRKHRANHVVDVTRDQCDKSVTVTPVTNVTVTPYGTGRDGTEQETTTLSNLESDLAHEVKSDAPQLELVCAPSIAPPTQSPAERAEKSMSDDAFQVWAHWKETLRHPNAKVDSKRSKIINNALKNYTVEDLQRAITGCSKSAYHMGANDRHTRYDSLELILRDSTQIEKFMGLANAA
jgi:hypothetical protein